MMNSTESTSDYPFILIMAGGVGSRFWPASREDHPKQFLDILGTGRSLIQMTFDRFTKWVPASNIYVITNEKYRALVSQHLPELNNDQIIGEPSRNNTAPCVAYASMKLHKLNPNAVCIVSPSDHIILKEDAFLAVIKKASEFAADHNSLITLGITPVRPDIGYGYIDFDQNIEPESDFFKVKEFKEKPILEVAQKYVETGHYLWNSGMFIWKLSEILAAFKKHSNQIYTSLNAGLEYYNTKDESKFVDEVYPLTKSISIDYAILERADNVFTLPSDIGWSDLGAWSALYHEFEKDKNANATIGGNTQLYNVSGTLIKTNHPQRKIIVDELSDFMIIDVDDVLLIAPRSKVDKIKFYRQQAIDKWKS